MDQVLETTLDNGLKVLIQESHAAPVATCWIWYRVGSRNERPGTTGISHWVEHMLFKGTERLAKGEVFRIAARLGGHNNAFTSEDFTVYYETLPAAHWEVALEIEADRMVNARFDPAEVASERSVILAEREGLENSPSFLLAEEMGALTFRVHPYRWSVIGERCDLEAMTRDELYAHYRAHYAPDNAILVLVGDFASEAALSRVQHHFGPIQARSRAETVRAVEPEQRGERRVTVRRPGSSPFLHVAYHTPAVGHPDVYPLMMLDAVLSGGKSVSRSGGGYMGRSARLYRALVDKELATSAGSGFQASVDPNLFSAWLTVRPGVEPRRAEEALLHELEHAAKEAPTSEEMGRARRQCEAQFAYARDGVTSQAFALGYFERLGSWHDMVEHVDRLHAVTPDDIQRVAAGYLVETNRCVGLFLPTPSAGDGDGQGHASQVAAYDIRNQPYPQSTRSLCFATGTFRPRREILANGITLLWNENHTTPSVAIRGSLMAGSVAEPAVQPGLASFTARMLRRGTRRRSSQEISAAVEALGASFSIWAGSEEAAFSVKCLGADVVTVLEMVRECLAEPSFPEHEIQRTRGEVLTQFREIEDSPRALADRAMAELLYPAGHPYARPSVGVQESVERFAGGDLKGFHEARYGPAGMLVSLAGDADTDAVRRHLARWFAGRPGPERVPPPLVRPSGDPRRRVIPLPHKSQAEIVIAGPGLRRDEPDYYALNVANLILGSLGMMGRLGERVRDQQGMAYYVYSRLHARLWSGEWLASAGVNPANVERAIQSILAEVRRIRNEPIPQTEFADAIANLVGSMALRLETNDGIAGYLLNTEYYGLGMDYAQRYPGLIGALTREQVEDAARRYLDPVQLSVVIAGPYTEG
jgi:zinc protease